MEIILDEMKSERVFVAIRTDQKFANGSIDHHFTNDCNKAHSWNTEGGPQQSMAMISQFHLNRDWFDVALSEIPGIFSDFRVESREDSQYVISCCRT